MTYAKDTAVPIERSKAEIERSLGRFGASHFAYATMPEGALVEFVKSGKRIRFLLPLPAKDLREFTHYRDGYGYEKPRDPSVAQGLWEKAARRLWRSLALIIKAKLVAVQDGVCTFEEEFLAHIVLPGGRTAGQHLIPKIEEAYANGKVPQLGWEGQP